MMVSTMHMAHANVARSPRSIAYSHTLQGSSHELCFVFPYLFTKKMFSLRVPDSGGCKFDICRATGIDCVIYKSEISREFLVLFGIVTMSNSKPRYTKRHQHDKV